MVVDVATERVAMGIRLTTLLLCPLALCLLAAVVTPAPPRGSRLSLRKGLPKRQGLGKLTIVSNLRKSGPGWAAIKRLAKVRGAKVPFIVGKVDEKGRTFVMARGLAWAKVKGNVAPGDRLVTSSRSLCAEKDNTNKDPSRSLGVAASRPVDGKVLVRILR